MSTFIAWRHAGAEAWVAVRQADETDAQAEARASAAAPEGATSGSMTTNAGAHVRAALAELGVSTIHS